jgi:hypothetical protein
LQFNKNSGKGDEKNGLWSAYCAFHLGDYKAALEVRMCPITSIIRNMTKLLLTDLWKSVQLNNY